MRADIDFSKLKRKPQTKGQQILTSVFCLIAFLSLSIIGVVTAYFTASAQIEGQTSFGRISVAFLDNSNNILTDANFSTRFVSDLTPGDTIDLSGVKVKNNGTHEAYVLINVDISIEKEGAETLHYNKWYDIYGQEVITSNMAVNATKPTLLGVDETVNTNIKWKVPGRVLTTEYNDATAKITMSAYGAQTNLQHTSTYVDPDLYASYYICKTAAKATQDTEGRNLFNKNATPILSYSSDQSRVVTDSGLILTNKSTSKSIMSVYSIGAVEEYAGKTIYVNADIKLNNVQSIYLGIGYANQQGGDRVVSTISISADGSYQKSTTVDATNYAGKVVAVFLYSHASSGTGAVVGSSVEYSNLMVSVGDCAYSPYNGSHIIMAPSGDPLMKVGTVEDSYDYATNTLTRNIYKIILTGTESWVQPSNYFSIDPQLGANTSNRSTAICNYYSYGDANANKSFWIDSSGKGLRIRDIDFANANELKSYLAEQYANGTPVTVWYQLATPTTEFATASKNIYQGDQNIHFVTGDSTNNTTLYVGMNITKGAGVDVKVTTAKDRQLGGDIFKIMWNNPTVLSYKIKMGSSDTNTTSKLTLRYYNESTRLENQQSYHDFTNDGRYHHVYISLPALSTLHSGNVTRVQIMLSSYDGSDPTRDLNIKDIQLEIGESPTDYEPYEKAIYSYVNGKPLYTSVSTFDTYDGENGEITRNVNKIEFTGEESKWYPYLGTNEGISFQYMGFTDKAIGFNKSICSHYTNKSYAWSSANIDGLGIYSDHLSSMTIYFRAPLGRADITTIEAWRAYLAEQYANGTPLTVWYELQTPITEEV